METIAAPTLSSQSWSPAEFPLPPVFQDDAERFRWAIGESERRTSARDFLSKATAYRATGALAFTVSLDVLLYEKRGVQSVCEARQKIVCLTFLMTGTTPARLGRLFNRNHSTIIHSCKLWTPYIAPLIADLMPCADSRAC